MNLLPIINDHDDIIGHASRAEIHAQGLRHREVHVWFVTPDQHVICQRRGATKDSYPSRLDATVGGHVERGQDYLQAALMEIQEETGLNLTADALEPLGVHSFTQHVRADFINNVSRAVYLYRWQGQLADLQIEAEEGGGFEAIPLSVFTSPTPPPMWADQLVPGLHEEPYPAIWAAIATAFNPGAR